MKMKIINKFKQKVMISHKKINKFKNLINKENYHNFFLMILSEISNESYFLS